MSEVDGHLQTVAQSFTTGEFLPVVDCQCLTQLWRDDAEWSFFGRVQNGAGAVFHLSGDEETALAFAQVLIDCGVQWMQAGNDFEYMINGCERAYVKFEAMRESGPRMTGTQHSAVSEARN